MSPKRSILADRSGGVAVYSAMLAAVAIGGMTLAVDYGRMTLLKSQMQDRADAAAMAAAVHLDSRDGARADATDVALNAATQSSAIPSDQAELIVQSVSFYSTWGSSPEAATSDSDARYVEVVLQPRQVEILFAPVLNLVSSGGAPEAQEIDAQAVAGSDPFVCNVPPLMMCNPEEDDPSLDLGDPANAGRQFRLKEPQSGGGTWAPGNFGLLEPADGGSGAADIEEALAAVTPPGCYGLDVDTATGSKTNKVRDGINARFDLPDNDHPYPAPDVINYPRDTEIIADPDEHMGSGTWDADAYWNDKHGLPLPPDLDGASRYQVYLYEQGLEYARNGKRTIYPVEDELPEGYETVTPPGEDIPTADDPENAHDPDYDGEPSQEVASNGQARRLVRVAVIDCQANNVHGAGTFPTDGRFAEMFLTEHVKEPPEAAIYGEHQRLITSTNSPDFVANVRLVE